MTSREELFQQPEYWLERIQNNVFRIVEDYMNRKGINQSELAQEWGVSKGYVSQILNGNFNFSLTKLIELCLKVGIAPELVLTSLCDFTRHEELRINHLRTDSIHRIEMSIASNEFFNEPLAA
ncbi:MAG: helix-turn-helix transcriptional regulator [Cytophagales bacterium]|nr:helix-turn-helix transcriptional regulator [Cytophagales bacterium]